ncbi:MAG: hypothetical protein OEM60_09815 [Gammaproteobacteria bacterium]|nr:hypothetical protein [Gammaproteobacteria bacterium]MDH3434144.1 hypothetical protein [Gammaproteobacteria bacterium]
MNLMKIKTLIAVTLLCLGFAAAAQDRIVSQAYEVALSDFRAPATENGGAAFKECRNCARRIVRVTSGTRYAVNGQSLSLEKFREAISKADDRDEKSVTVLHHLESDTIVSIDVYI